MYYTYYTDCN